MHKGSRSKFTLRQINSIAAFVKVLLKFKNMKMTTKYIEYCSNFCNIERRNILKYYNMFCIIFYDGN